MAESSLNGQMFSDKLTQIIEANLQNEHFGVNELAREAGLSRSMLHRKLMNQTGKPASEFITLRRLEKAKELLEKSDFTAAEIAYKTGFNSPSYFNKVFKKYHQLSPCDYRKGKKIVSADKSIGAKQSNRLIKNSVFLVSTILFAAVLTWAGLHFFKGKTEVAEKSIAILPFDNISSNNDNQYFADGIVEDLLTRLSSLNNLKVISRTSSEMFRNKGDKTIPEIGKILGVGYILEGTVQRESDKIRISVQLIDAKNDDHVLSKQYNRNLFDFFEVQSEIASEIASELSLALSTTEQTALKRDRTNNLKAFEYMQLGRYHLNTRTRDGFFNSLKYFKLAIHEDPNYALAYAEMADTYFLMAWYGYVEFQSGRDSAINMALKALEMDESLGEAHTVLGVVYNEYDLQYAAAKREFIKALELNSNHSTTYQYYSEYLATEGKLQEARELLNKAIRLDPFSYIIRYANSLLYCKEGDFLEALNEIEICQDFVKDNPGAVLQELRIHLHTNDQASAYKCFARLGQINGEWTMTEADSIYQSAGINELIIWGINKGEWISEWGKARYYSLLGEEEEALKILEKLVDTNKLFPFITGSAEFKNLRSNQRFIAIRKKMGLPPLNP
jgi:TolB-like protein/AraC-like DNA-binding protein